MGLVLGTPEYRLLYHDSRAGSTYLYFQKESWAVYEVVFTPALILCLKIEPTIYVGIIL